MIVEEGRQSIKLAIKDLTGIETRLCVLKGTWVDTSIREGRKSQ